MNITEVISIHLHLFDSTEDFLEKAKDIAVWSYYIYSYPHTRIQQFLEEKSITIKGNLYFPVSRFLSPEHSPILQASFDMFGDSYGDSQKYANSQTILL